MKLTVILLFGSLMAMSASSYSQNTKLNLSAKNSTLIDIFRQIEDQSEFYFYFKKEDVKSKEAVSVELKDALVTEILDQVLDKTGLEYKIIDRYVVVKEKGDADPAMVMQQERKVSGKVTDAGGASLPGVSVVVKGTTTGVITDNSGNYSLSNIPENATLQFSFVGMKTQEIKVGNQTTINIVLSEETIGLEEVVAVGYGTQKKGNLTGSISSVKSQDLVVSPVASTANALAGRLPGLISLQSSGQPGADAAKLSIRGFGDALIIVDGVETSFNNIDANQIESVTILKDGSASIYGSRAGNGVILVTTKRGVSGKPMFSLNTTFTGQALTAFPRLMGSGEITEFAREGWINMGRPAETAPYKPEEIQKYFDGTDPQYPNTNWRKLLIRDWTPQQQHNISVRGGSEKIKYFGLISYLDQESMWKSGKGGTFNRYNLQSNIDAKITDNLSLRLDISTINEYRKYPWRSQTLAIFQDFFQTSPMYPATLPDPTKLSYAAGGGTGGIHLMSNSDIAGYDNTDGQTLNTTLSLDYKVKRVQGLSLRGLVNVIQYNSFEKFFLKPLDFWTYDISSQVYTYKGSLYTKAYLNEFFNRARTITSQYSANYDRIFAANHHLSGFVLYEGIDYSGDGFYGGRKDFMTPAIDQLYMGTAQSSTINGSAFEMGRKSVVSRVNYSFKDKYLLEATLRADASAKFPSNKRWGYFPSVSLGWKISEEGFIKNKIKAIDNLKLRASFGESGLDQVGNFQYLEGYTLGYAAQLGGIQQNGMTSTGLANPNLTWERIKIYNVGTDFSLFDRKLFGEMDVFYRDLSGIPATRLASLPSTFGATQPPENLNSMNNRGFELMLGTSGNTGNFKYDVTGNISWSRAKWGHYEEPTYTDPDQERLFKISGRWTDYQFGYRTDGLLTTQAQIDAMGYDMDGQGNVSLKPGDLIYLDNNGDKKVDWKDQVEIGKGTTPHWMVGINTNLQYKNFDLSALFQGAFGYYNYIGSGVGAMQPMYVYEMRWSELNNNPNAFIPRVGSTSSAGGGMNDHFYRKAGYLRLKTMAIGYNLPQYLAEKISCTKVRIYAAGTNLYTLNKLRKFEIDPEVPSGNTGQSYPQQLTVTFGVNVSF